MYVSKPINFRSGNRHTLPPSGRCCIYAAASRPNSIHKYSRSLLPPTFSAARRNHTPMYPYFTPAVLTCTDLQHWQSVYIITRLGQRAIAVGMLCLPAFLIIAEGLRLPALVGDAAYLSLTVVGIADNAAVGIHTLGHVAGMVIGILDGTSDTY